MAGEMKSCGWVKVCLGIGITKFGDRLCASDRLWNARDWFQGSGIKKQMDEGVNALELERLDRIDLRRPAVQFQMCSV